MIRCQVQGLPLWASLLSLRLYDFIFTLNRLFLMKILRYLYLALPISDGRECMLILPEPQLLSSSLANLLDLRQPHELDGMRDLWQTLKLLTPKILLRSDLIFH